MSTKKTSMNWLKGVLSAREEAEPVMDSQSPADLVSVETKSDNPLEPIPTKQNIFSRDNQDKTTLDLIVSVENMLHDRQILTFKNKGLQEQLQTANEHILRLKQEQQQRDQQLHHYEKELVVLEEKLTNKQMSYDQLIEDYRDFQNNSQASIENLKFQLEKEQSKYSKLEEELSKHQYHSMQQVNQLEERIRDLEVENQKLNDQYQRISNEKAQLVHTINDFTARMSVSFNTTEVATKP